MTEKTTLNAFRLNVDLGAKIIKDGRWFWPEMKCGCGTIGCYDLTTDIGCRSCLIERGKIVVTIPNERSFMTEAELIARQAKQIEELRDELSGLKKRASKARMHIYCIGGPLNDNKLGYSKAQMVTFARIADELAD